MKIRKSITDPSTGKQRLGTVVEVEEEEAPTSHFKLVDGTIIKVRLVLAEVIKFDDLGTDGRPQFNFNVQVVSNIHLPDEIVQ